MESPESKQESKPEVTPDEGPKQEESEFIDERRLYLMNLSYQVTKEELAEAFGKFGKIVDIEIPFRKKGKGVPLGIGFIRFETSEAAISAYAEMDKSFF
jgi:RNA recognition motif-containing protein